ncbi:MAG TPA: PLD nuclease N-terminal domain-containing protein [Bacillota bacterium]|nr:PLD nuclease N-terminal domain-containing protein [Bacillota bacterium]
MAELIQSINWAIVAPLIGIQVILAVVALVDLIKAEHVNGPKWMWSLIIVFINIIGPVVYFVVGRREF